MTYNAVLKDDHLEWIGTPPDYNPAEPLNVQVEIVSPSDNDAWDKQMAEDSAAGKLDALMDAALEDYHAGRSTAL